MLSTKPHFYHNIRMVLGSVMQDQYDSLLLMLSSIHTVSDEVLPEERIREYRKEFLRVLNNFIEERRKHAQTAGKNRQYLKQQKVY